RVTAPPWRLRRTAGAQEQHGVAVAEHALALDRLGRSVGDAQEVLHAVARVECDHALSLGFFFPADDGIRDKLVTGVQTCALPIWAHYALAGVLSSLGSRAEALAEYQAALDLYDELLRPGPGAEVEILRARTLHRMGVLHSEAGQIGRATCRERV